MNNPAPVFAAERLVPFEGIVQLRDAQAAVYAADGYTRSTGRPALVITLGVAQALQAASGLLTSWGDKQPVVVLNRVHPDQFASLRKTYSAVTRSSFTLDAPGDARIFAETNKRALPLAVPIQWLLPENTDLAPVLDAWSGMGSEHPARDVQGETGWEDSVATTVETLGAARRPVVLLGAGAAGRVDPALIADLAGRLDCPVLLTAAATTMPVGALEKLRIAMDSAGALIPSGNLVWVKALGSADVILAIGTALSEVDWFGFTQLKLSRRAKILRIGLEKVEREIGHRFIQMDARRFVSELIRKLSGGPHGPAQGIRTSRWRRARDRWLSVTAAEAERCRSLNYIEPRFAIREIAQAAPAETLFISEGGACGMWLWSALWLRPFIFPVQHGTIGVPIPMAVGAAVGHPGRPIWGVVGDGAFLYNAKELETASGAGSCRRIFRFQ